MSEAMITTEDTENTEKGLIECSDELVGRVIGAAIAVHKELGAGLLESVYEAALAIELTELGIEANRQVEIAATYRGRPLGLGFRADILVAGGLLLELKAVEKLNDVHLGQVITYLRMLRIKRALLINFNERLLKNGIRRISI
jgi:GxxExxY protein